MDILTVWHVYPLHSGEPHIPRMEEPRRMGNIVEQEHWELPDGYELGKNAYNSLGVFRGGELVELRYNPAGTALILYAPEGPLYLKRQEDPPKVHPIAAARAAAGMTMRGLAAAIGVNKNTIYMIETGQCIPKATTLRHIADVLGKTMDELWP